ncbi:aspartic peptidase domain-containing protein [Cantharellus anzutake]|uniref:aspartic peptidase domain-containing protein n=1 Tax=Cantharellus anzutake TaxID=1750568 RepID=UPI001905B3A1|nr:aspartic peptidase domain-containing protein [Cantharellus anzutake]KAF8340558.1 aspartic peptidase domain-containing protein [Cantharellus anzutake]
MIVDTGSANTWVGASTRYAGSGCSATFQVSYGSGSVSGKECTGSVSVGSLTVPAQSFGAASSASGFDGVDGIFGVGPTDLTSGTVSGTNTVPTFLDNAYSQGSISTEVLGVYFKPETGSDTADQNGELTLGGVDTSKYTGPLTYFPKSIVSPFSYYWGINIVSIMYGITTISSSASAIVDTGTTLIYIPTPAYQAFLKASGSSTDPTTGLSSWTTRPTGTISFMIGNSAFPLSPAQYLIPAAQYGPFGLPSGKFYSWISDGGASGVNFIIGQKFLENYYSVYDTTNSRIGFATRA